MDINSYLVPGKRAHLAGIGGVSMSPLAEVLHSMGLSVQGSDMNDSPAVEHLRALGIPVAIGHAADNLGDADFVVRTAAIHDDNPEISGAVARGIPVFERAQAWGAIMRGYRNALCISGTHGKTTTTSMATHIFMAAGTSSAKRRKECSTSCRSLKKSRWSASTLRMTATVGKKLRNELQYSQLSAMMVSPWPTR